MNNRGLWRHRAKTTACDIVTKATLKLFKPMTVFAHDTNNPELKEEINISWIKLRFEKDQDVIDRWQPVHTVRLPT